MARSVLHPPGPNRQTSQPYPGYMVPTFRTAGETLPNHFTSLSSSGTTGDNNTESPSSFGCVILLVVLYHRLIILLLFQSRDLQCATRRAVQCYLVCLIPNRSKASTLIVFDSICGRRFLQRDEEQQSFDSGKQSSCHSYDANHSRMELHPSKFISPEVRYSMARSVPRPPSPNMQSSQLGCMAPTFRTAGETLPNHFIPLSGSGTTGDNTTESSSSPRCVILLVVLHHRLIIFLYSQSHDHQCATRPAVQWHLVRLISQSSQGVSRH